MGYVTAGLSLLGRQPLRRNALFDTIASTPALWEPTVRSLLRPETAPNIPFNISAGCSTPGCRDLGARTLVVPNPPALALSCHSGVARRLTRACDCDCAASHSRPRRQLRAEHRVAGVLVRDAATELCTQHMVNRLCKSK